MDGISLSAGPITLGVTTAIVTSFIQSLGLTLQRKSHVNEESRPVHQRRRPFRRGLWRLGLIIFLSSNVLGSTVQLTTLPLVVLAPIQASGLIFNAILASLILHEGFTALSLLGTVWVSVGAGLIAGFGALEEPSHNLQELLAMFERLPFLIWVGVQLGIVVIILVVSRLLLLSIRRRSAIIDNAGLGFLAISSLAVGKSIKRLKLIRGCILGCLSGLISAHCLLLAKTAVELVVRSVTDKNQFSNWQSWIFVVSLLLLELAQVYQYSSMLTLVVLFEFRTAAVLDDDIVSSDILHLQYHLHSGRSYILSTNIPINDAANRLCRYWNDHLACRRSKSFVATVSRTRTASHDPACTKSVCFNTRI